MNSAVIHALLIERLGYERRGLHERVALVDEQLRALGHQPLENASAPEAPERSTAPKSRRRKG